MPVPVKVTNPLGQGLIAHQIQQLPSEGPFARLKKAAVQQEEPQKAVVASPIVASPAPSEQNGQPESQPQELQQPPVQVNNLTFSYPGLDGRPIPGMPPMINNMTLQLPAGSRCLLLGANGAGKTTLLKILGGKHMVPEEAVSILGRPPFHDTQLIITGDLAYVGGTWVRDIAFAGNSVPLTGDFPAQRMIDAVPGVDQARKDRLIKVLDIDPQWRMHQVSDGQRRRVQICVGLLKKFKVLLLDEITVDLDVLGRADLMSFLKEECEMRGACIIYATHIFDGLESWPTHIAYVAHGHLQLVVKAEDVPELKQGCLLDLVNRLLTEEKDRVAKIRGPRPTVWDPSREGQVDLAFSYAFNNGWAPGTLTSSLYASSNAVMRN